MAEKPEAREKRKARLAKLKRDHKERRREVREQEKGKRDDRDRRLFVANLPEKTTSEDLSGLFERFGPVHSTSLVVNSKKRFRGVGFVTFESTEALEKALQVSGIEFKGQALKVAKATPPPPVYDVRVSGLRGSTEELKLRKHFGSWLIKEVCIDINGETKKCEGTATIRFKAVIGAEKALKLHDSMFMHRKITVQPIKAEGESKEDKKRSESKPGNAGREAAEAKGEKQKAEKPAPGTVGGLAAEANSEKRQASKIAAEELTPKKKIKTLKEKKEAQA